MNPPASPPPVDGPRYQQIAAVLRQQIEAGEYPVGSQLPTEGELCTTHRISRYTAREALRRLAEAGFIQRRQGSGSVVLATSPARGYVHSMHSLDELFQYAADTTLHIIEQGSIIPGPEFEIDLGSGCQDTWLWAEGVRTEAGSGAPICYVQLFVNHDFAAIAPALRHVEGAIHHYLETHFGVEVSEVEQVIRIAPLPPSAVSALKTRRKSTAGRVTRRYLGRDGRVLLVSVNHHPAEHFSYSMQMRRDDGNWA